jgi:hypothetical protein
MVIILVKDSRLIIAMDDLDFEIKNVAFEAMVFNRYGTFDQIANKNMEDLGYAYLHCDLLDKTFLTKITLRVKSLHIEMHEQHLQKGIFMRVENFNIELKSKKGFEKFEKGDMHVVITIKSITIVSLILAFQLELVPMFFHLDSIREFKSYIYSYKSVTIVVIVICVRGIENNRAEKQLLITNGKGKFDQDVIIFGNNFKIEYEQFLEMYNGSQCVMVLIKNVTITSKGD